ncbi:MAG: 7-carboxy-7-deazaguanine synthase, partial [Thermoplasmata archaeon]
MLGFRERMKVCEIFYSIQGEGELAGYPTIFIRLTGCNLRCRYCDTEYAFYEGKEMGIDDIIER